MSNTSVRLPHTQTGEVLPEAPFSYRYMSDIIAALIAALGAVTFHTMRAARINPAETLHDE